MLSVSRAGSPSAPSVRHWDRLWSSAIKGEGDWRLVCFVVTRVTLPPCGYCLEASMTAEVGSVLFTRVTLPPCGYCLEASMTGPG